MRKYILSILIIAIVACSGFAAGVLFEKKQKDTPRITGIGGVFFKCKKPADLKAWYSKYFGLAVNQYGTNFVWYEGADSTHKAYTQWSPFGSKTTYFAPSTKDFMINYRVAGLRELMKKLAADNILPLDKVDSSGYGQFVHYLDPDSNKIELWEPVDANYEVGNGVSY